MNTNDVLKFGKFKGQRLGDTPEWYRNWFAKQDWFNRPQPATADHRRLHGWDGYGKKGAAIYERIFESEKRDGDEMDRRSGMYELGGLYYGI